MAVWDGDASRAGSCTHLEHRVGGATGADERCDHPANERQCAASGHPVVARNRLPVNLPLTDLRTVARNANPLEEQGLAFLRDVYYQYGLHDSEVKDNEVALDLLNKGLLFNRSSPIGGVITLGWAGCQMLGLPPSRVPTTDSVANVIYMRAAILLMQREGMRAIVHETATKAHLISRNKEKVLLLAKVDTSGHSRKTVGKIISLLQRGLDVDRVIIVSPVISQYVRLSNFHDILELWHLDPVDLPTILQEQLG